MGWRNIGVNSAEPNQDAEDTNWASHISESIRALRGRIEFREDAAPCVSVVGGSDPEATRATQEATELASTAQSKAESAQQGAQQARQQAESATQTAREAQVRAEQVAQAVAEVGQMTKLTSTFIAMVAVVTLVALGLALRKPRQEIIRIAGRIAEPLSRRSKPGRKRLEAARPA